MLSSILPSYLLHRPKVAHATLESRVPVPASPGGVELLSSNKRLRQIAILFTCALHLVIALEWNGFEYFRRLACKIRDLANEEEMNNVGLAEEESDWNTYTYLLDPLQKKKKIGMRARIGNLFRRMSTNRGNIHICVLCKNAILSVTKFTSSSLLFCIEVQKQDGIQDANKYFKERQYEQHHHVVRVSLQTNQPTYLESLSSKHIPIDSVQIHHKKNYLDTLSDLKATSSTLEDCKMKVDCATKADSTVKDLKEFERMMEEFDDTIGRDTATQKTTGRVEDEVLDSIVYEL